MTLQVQSPFQQFFGLDGDPLDNGSIYIGNSGQDPQQYPIPIFWDAAGTISALQPVKTLNGYAVRNGTPSRIWVDNVDYSITVKDSRGRVVFTALSVTAVSFGALAAPTGSSLVGFIQAGAHAVPRTVLDRGRDAVSIKDFANYSTNAAQAILDMAADYGFVRIPFGNFPVGTSVTIDVPIWFDEGAALTAAGGITITIRNVVESPRQFIFQGTGNYVLTQNDLAAGENSREVHASWFGAFPNLGDLSDQGPAINRAFAAMGNGRESIVHFDIGGYVINTTVTITRAGWVKGAGTRRTVFKSSLDGFPFFVDSSTGIAKITDCNFETIGGLATRTSPFIAISFNESELYNIRMGQTDKGIVVTGNAARIHSITGVYGSTKPVGSDLIQIKSGSGSIVENISLSTSSNFGPETLVRVGGTGSTGAGFVNISKMYYITPCVGVMIEAFSSNIQDVLVDAIQFNAFNGLEPAQIVKLETTGTGTMDNMKITGVQGATRSLAVVSLLQNSSGTMRRISIDHVQDRRINGNGIELIRTNGAIEEVSIGAGVQLKTRTNPIFRSGDLGPIWVAPGVERDSSAYLSRSFNLANDTAYSIDLGKSTFSALVNICAATGSTLNNGQYAVRAAPSPSVTVITQTTDMATAIIPLTGTTGTVGKFTLGVTDQILYLENRTGAAVNVAIGITGIR